jgi:hypothetical protein
MTKHSQKYPTIRISARTHQIIKELAREDQVSMADVVDQAIEQMRRERIMRHANDVWANAMKDPEVRKAWEQEDREIELTFWTPITEPWDEDIEEEPCPKTEG